MLRPSSPKLQFSPQKGIHLIDPGDIVHCRAEGNYTRFFLDPNKQLLFCHQLGQVEQMLPATYFLRVHHSHIVNRNFLVEYCYEHGGCVVLSDGEVVPVARRRRQEVKKWLKGRGEPPVM